MNVYFPLETNHMISGVVRESVMAQTGVGAIKIIECRTPGEYLSRGNFTPARIVGEKASRLMARDQAAASGEDICVVQDYGYAHLTKEQQGPKYVTNPHNDNFLLMLDFLKKNTDYGAVSIVHAGPAAKGEKHIDIGCCIWRVDVLKQIMLDKWTAGSACETVVKEIRALGNKIDYLPGPEIVTKI